MIRVPGAQVSNQKMLFTEVQGTDTALENLLLFVLGLHVCHQKIPARKLFPATKNLSNAAKKEIRLEIH